MVYRVLRLFGLSLLLLTNVWAQDDDFDGPAPREKMVQKIEDLRKMRLLDVLNLQGDQVEIFFASYNRLQRIVLSARRTIERNTIELREATSSQSDDATLKAKTESVLAAMRGLEDAVNRRHAELRPLLSAKQYAAYIAFEARFQEELTRLIMQRARKSR